MATVFFVLGMTTSALGAAQQAKPFDGTNLTATGSRRV
jgi:hypothetical protein